MNAPNAPRLMIVAVLAALCGVAAAIVIYFTLLAGLLFLFVAATVAFFLRWKSRR